MTQPTSTTKKTAEPKDNGSEPKEVAVTSDRIPATEADYIAVQLHAEREQKNNLRRILAVKEKTIVELQTQLGNANSTILQLQIEADETANAELRKTRSFQLNKTITKDNDGNVFWEPAQQQPQK